MTVVKSAKMLAGRNRPRRFRSPCFRPTRRASLAVMVLLFMLLFSAFDAPAQKRKKKAAHTPQTELADRVAKAKEDVVAAAQAYKESLVKLLAFQEADVKTATET